MGHMVKDMNVIEVLVYLDNIIIFGKTLEEHEEQLEDWKRYCRDYIKKV